MVRVGGVRERRGRRRSTEKRRDRALRHRPEGPEGRSRRVRRPGVARSASLRAPSLNPGDDRGGRFRKRASSCHRRPRTTKGMLLTRIRDTVTSTARGSGRHVSRRSLRVRLDAWAESSARVASPRGGHSARRASRPSPRERPWRFLRGPHLHRLRRVSLDRTRHVHSRRGHVRGDDATPRREHARHRPPRALLSCPTSSIHLDAPADEVKRARTKTSLVASESPRTTTTSTATRPRPRAAFARTTSDSTAVLPTAPRRTSSPFPTDAGA